ncbi:hypothetical protein [Streptomyces rugosispiralis]|uniref:Uncharacterized protein n=1 Tax=Streptomyces rugosispiralis TaxID=2967341 RepID=A0ABT1URZ7_9ACTN|nr:hypothetical protein [Streptomyces rugosispiralis]MCQ8187885.1 hypothetical protein [Streptomyces rugosispiralis]
MQLHTVDPGVEPGVERVRGRIGEVGDGIRDAPHGQDLRHRVRLAHGRFAAVDTHDAFGAVRGRRERMQPAAEEFGVAVTAASCTASVTGRQDATSAVSCGPGVSV